MDIGVKEKDGRNEYASLDVGHGGRELESAHELLMLTWGISDSQPKMDSSAKSAVKLVKVTKV